MDGAQPDWDMEAFFPGVESGEFLGFRDGLRRELAELLERLRALPALTAASLEDWTQALLALEALGQRAGHLQTYLSCRRAADSSDSAVARETAAMGKPLSLLQKMSVTVQQALARASEAEFKALANAPELRDVRYFLERARTRAGFSMEQALEDLAAELAVDGINAWGRLYGQLSGVLEFELNVAGQPPRRVPVSMARTLMEDPDRAVREAAFEGSNGAWRGAADTVAACLNAISGTRLSLYPRRGVVHFLDPALFDACIERRTLETLLDVVRSRQELARRYLRRKAELLGLERLAFYDVSAPLPGTQGARIDWGQARERVSRAFGDFHPELGALSESAFTERWIDHQPRASKRPGGFCASAPLLGQSRIFMTFNGAEGDLSTLAHELGHAFHGRVMDDMRPWQRRYPMTLAETASTFAEQVVTEAALAAPGLDANGRRAILDQRLAAAATFLCNIPMRFDFEHALYERRAAGELTVDELQTLVLEAQRKNYGDALDPEGLDPMFWASKLHFYITSLSFYNFPYTFGYLFSLGIFARARREGAGFFPIYQELLRKTGSGSAEEVAASVLGVDLQEPEFWNQSIDLIEADLERFVALAEE
ncbi:MAG: M3 family oligoendopeptidase [Myxococcales bacterium]|nr:M3 family oligoendopeptidase [Myxococcales bacterium]